MPATPAALAVRADLAPAANLLADTSLADDFPIDVLAADLDDATLLARTLHWYQQHFAQQGAAAEALRRRGLLAEDLVETFEIGYAARELARQLPSATSAAGRRLRERWQTLGLYRASGHGHFAGCLTFPLRDTAGGIQQVYGRKVGQRLTARSELHSYLLGRDLATSAALFNPIAFTVSDRLLLTDSPLNALSLWCAGLRHVSCTFHGAGISDALLSALTAQSIRQVTLIWRQTDAGQAAAVAAAARLQALDIAVAQVPLPDGLDANDVLRQQGTDRLALRVEHAQAARPARSERTTNTPTQSLAQPAIAPAAVVAAVPETPVASSDTSVSPPHDLPAALDELHFTYDDRHYRVRGLAENLSPQRLKLNVQVRRDGLFHVHLFDLYSASQRRQFIRDVSDELFVTEERIKHDLANCY